MSQKENISPSASLSFKKGSTHLSPPLGTFQIMYLILLLLLLFRKTIITENQYRTSLIFIDSQQTWTMPAWVSAHTTTFFCSSSPLTGCSGNMSFDSWIGLLSRRVCSAACSELPRLSASWERPRNFSLALKKSMRSELRADGGEAERPASCTVALGCLWWLSSLARPSPVQSTSASGTCWLNFCLSSGTCVCCPAAEEEEEEEFGACLLGSGVLLLTHPVLVGEQTSGCSWLSGLTSASGWCEGGDAGWWRAAGGWGWFTRTASAMFTGAELGRAPGTTVAALGLGRSDDSSAARLSSELPRPFVKGASRSQSFCPAEEGLRVWSSSCSDGDVWLLPWFRGLDRPSDCAAGVLTSGSWCSDRLLSEWERHSLLCLCLLWRRGVQKRENNRKNKSDKWNTTRLQSYISSLYWFISNFKVHES